MLAQLGGHVGEEAVRRGEEDVARTQAVHVDDGVGGELHLLLEAEAPRRLDEDALAGRRAEGGLARDDLVVAAVVALHVHGGEVGAVTHHEDLQRPRVAHRVREHPRVHLVHRGLHVRPAVAAVVPCEVALLAVAMADVHTDGGRVREVLGHELVELRLELGLELDALEPALLVAQDAPHAAAVDRQVEAERVRRRHLGHVPPVVARALVGAREVSLEAAEQLDLRTALRRPELQPEGGRRVLGPVVPACVGRVHRARCVECAEGAECAPGRSKQYVQIVRCFWPGLGLELGQGWRSGLRV